MSRNGQRKMPRAKQVQKALARAQEKERAKVAVHLDRLSKLNEGDNDPHMQELRRQMQLLVDGHNNLVTAYNTNLQNFGNSIQHLDARVGAIFIVLDDIVKRGISDVTTLGPIDLGIHEGVEHPQLGGVHWAGYIRMYMKKVEEDLALLKQQQQEAAAAVQDSAVPQAEPFDPLITPEEEPTEDDSNDVVFGGKDADVEASTGHATGTPG